MTSKDKSEFNLLHMYFPYENQVLRRSYERTDFSLIARVIFIQEVTQAQYIYIYVFINNFGQASLPPNWRTKLLTIKHYTILKHYTIWMANTTFITK